MGAGLRLLRSAREGSKRLTLPVGLLNTPVFPPQNALRTMTRAAVASALLSLVALAPSACFDGNAQPIVRIPVDASLPPPPLDGSIDSSSSTCDPTQTTLPFYYRNVQPAADANGIDFIFKIDNRTGAAFPLSELSIRYYFTNEITSSPQTSVFYSGTCCGETRTGFTADVLVTVNPMAATATADHYLEVTFDAGAGALLAGDAVQIEVGYSAVNHSQNLNQANDYSFVAANTSTQAAWDLCPTECAQFGSCVMTVYRNGTLVWGSPP